MYFSANYISKAVPSSSVISSKNTKIKTWDDFKLPAYFSTHSVVYQAPKMV